MSAALPGGNLDRVHGLRAQRGNDDLSFLAGDVELRHHADAAKTRT